MAKKSKLPTPSDKIKYLARIKRDLMSPKYQNIFKSKSKRGQKSKTLAIGRTSFGTVKQKMLNKSKRKPGKATKASKSLGKCLNDSYVAQPAAIVHMLPTTSVQKTINLGVPEYLTRRQEHLLKQREKLRNAAFDCSESILQPRAKLPAVAVDFFKNLGQKGFDSIPKKQPLGKKKAQQQRAAEIPLSGRLELIDYISTQQFAKMCRPRKQARHNW